MKIAFIGGGSVQWTPKLVTDMALTDTLAGAQLVLHDIDADALALLTRASKRIVAQVGGNLDITATTDGYALTISQPSTGQFWYIEETWLISVLIISAIIIRLHRPKINDHGCSSTP